MHFVCMDWRHVDDVSIVGRTIYGERLNLCIWNKSNAGMGSLYRSKHELVFVYRVGTAPHLNTVELGKHGRNRTNVWDYASVNSMRGSRREDLALHPTVKPTGLVADAIQDVTRRGDLVLDLFLGSGTTLMAAERTGRRFRGLDIDPSYVDVAIERWSARTGLCTENLIRVDDVIESRRLAGCAGASTFRIGHFGLAVEEPPTVKGTMTTSWVMTR
jgi:DNA modification methylase